MKLHFLGGVDTVTGSQHILEAGGVKVLRDCGLFQGRRDEARERNRHLPFDPAHLAAMTLSHAHIDHCGNIPSLAREGYANPIHATTATQEIAAIMLRDAARIQEQDASYLNQKTNRRGLPPVEPLYTVADAEAALPLFRGHAYGTPLEVAPGIEMTALDAGHILGAEQGLFTLRENGRTVQVGFALDLGRKNLPLLRDPECMTGLDALVLESTYGDRLHDDATHARDQLRDAIRVTLGRGGRVIIPTFALERAQEILYHLLELVADGQLPEIPVYVDSPMAASVTRVFMHCQEYMDAEFHALRRRLGDLMSPKWIKFTASVEESKAVTASREPCIIMAASGMCEHGRILHHLKHGISNPANTILIVGFQAANTLGRKLVEGQKRINIFGDEFVRRAEVRVLNAFSAHADRNELLTYVRAARPKKIYLVHGEAKQRAGLAAGLRAEKLAEVFIPSPGDTAEL